MADATPNTLLDPAALIPLVTVGDIDYLILKDAQPCGHSGATFFSFPYTLSTPIIPTITLEIGPVPAFNDVVTESVQQTLAAYGWRTEERPAYLNALKEGLDNSMHVTGHIIDPVQGIDESLVRKPGTDDLQTRLSWGVAHITGQHYFHFQITHPGGDFGVRKCLARKVAVYRGARATPEELSSSRGRGTIMALGELDFVAYSPDSRHLYALKELAQPLNSVAPLEWV